MWAGSAPLGWDTGDATGVADAAMFLLSDLSRAISGEIVHVDGGLHCVGGAGVQSNGGKAPKVSSAD